MIWFTSDTHFGHENVLKFTDRPWETIWQMNDAIVDNINGRVAVDDELYILGDFSFKMTAKDAYRLRKRIACTRLALDPGTHDKSRTHTGCVSGSPAGASTSSRETMTRTGPSRRSRARSPWNRRSACSRSTGRRSSCAITPWPTGRA